MAKTVVIEDGEEAVTGEAEHAAAVSEGAAAVHQENAAQAAAVATAASDATHEAVMMVSQAEASATEAAVVAEQAAEVSVTGADAVARALEVQTIAITSLLEEVRASKTPPAPVEEVKTTPDRAPGKPKRRGSWYYGR